MSLAIGQRARNSQKRPPQSLHTVVVLQYGAVRCNLNTTCKWNASNWAWSQKLTSIMGTEFSTTILRDLHDIRDCRAKNRFILLPIISLVFIITYRRTTSNANWETRIS